VPQALGLAEPLEEAAAQVLERGLTLEQLGPARGDFGPHAHPLPLQGVDLRPQRASLRGRKLLDLALAPEHHARGAADTASLCSRWATAAAASRSRLACPSWLPS